MKNKMVYFFCLKITGETSTASPTDADVTTGTFNLTNVVRNSLENIIVNGIMQLDLSFVLWIKK